MIEIIFSKNAEKTYQLLKSSNLPEDKLLLKIIDAKVELIKLDPQLGNKIKKKQIPKDLHINNLFIIPLPCYWRMLYTLKQDKLEILAFVIDIYDHKAYDKTMKY